MPSVGQLATAHTREEGRDTLVLRGELDLVTAPELEDKVAALCLEGVRELVLDLRHVVFMDSSGLRTVLASMDMCRLHGCEFVVVPGSAARRLFEITGVIKDVPLQDTDDELV